jgi:hypothetical protein
MLHRVVTTVKLGRRRFDDTLIALPDHFPLTLIGEREHDRGDVRCAFVEW